MCGIAGYFGKLPPKREFLKQTCEILKHRGPDAKGLYEHQFEDNNLVFIHRRLSIIDIDDRSNQPFKYQNNILIFNGEIYNYLELRSELQSLGHQFKTNSDTEVLVHALSQWGRDALDKLEGMWAFAWYNEKNGNLLLSRDRFGEKPLFIWKKDNGFYFSSEIKGLAALSGEWPKVNKNHLFRNMANGYKSLYKSKDTFFLNVKQLSPATFSIINTQGLSPEKKYWKPDFNENPNLSFNDAVAATKDSIIKSVKLRLRSDVPLAFCMSGGIDSNTLISIASKILNYNVHGFTIIDKDERYDEKNSVDITVNELGIKHSQVLLPKENFLTNLRSIVISHDAPVSTISYYMHWYLMNEIKNHGYKISISGTAADELFSGYYDHHLFYLASIYKDKKLFNQSKANWFNQVKPHVRNKYLHDPEIFLKNPKFRDHIFFERKFSQYFYNPFLEPFSEKEYPMSLLRKRMLNELFFETVPVILNEDDMNAMYYSIENRSPFLDRNLFETSLQIPTEFLITEGKSKSVLRESMKGIVPNHIIENPKKIGFNASIESLLDIKDNYNREQLLDDSSIFDFVKKSEIEKLIKTEKFSNNLSKFLFSFIGAKFFLEEFQRKS